MYAIDNGDLDPHLQWCRGCDYDFYPTVKFQDGLCPKCAAQKALAEEEEYEEDEQR